MRMTIVGSNPRAGGSECILFGRVGRRDGRFQPIARDSGGQGQAGNRDFSAHGGWQVREMRPGAGLGLACALVSSSAANSYCRTSGRLAAVAHRWSGVLQVHDVGRRYIIDLYSEETRLVLLDVVNEIVVDVTRLASTADGVLRLPDMTRDTIARHVLEAGAWFRLLQKDPAPDRRWTRRTLERFRGDLGGALRRRLVCGLLPSAGARLAPPPAPSLPDSDRLRDEMRLLTAAVEGLAMRGAAKI